MKRFVLMAAAVWAVAAWPAAANDTVASLAIGGLQFEKTDKIAMLSEDLFLSAKEVRVRYVFRNLTKAPVTVRVAFPLPDVDYSDEGANIGYPNLDDPNYVNFTTKVDGKPIALTPDVRAFVNGKDITAQILAAGLPLTISQAAQDRINAMAPDKLAPLVKAGLLRQERYDVGKGWQAFYLAQWTLRASFHREQTFPVGQDVVVEHRYQPAVGGSVASLLTIREIPKSDPDRRKLVRDYCVDAAFERAAAGLSARKDLTAITEDRFDYVLTTGANWARPIGDFRLVVDKGAAENLVSFCAAGVKKISPTQFEWRARNFTPKRDIRVLVLKPYKE
jgi:hypothetical protein